MIVKHKHNYQFHFTKFREISERVWSKYHYYYNHNTNLISTMIIEGRADDNDL